MVDQMDIFPMLQSFVGELANRDQSHLNNPPSGDFKARLAYILAQDPLDNGMLQNLSQLVTKAFAAAGTVYMAPSTAAGVGFVLFLRPMPVDISRDVCCWLGERLLSESTVSLGGQSCKLMMGSECSQYEALAASTSTLKSLNDWWSSASSIPPQEGRIHRKRLQAYIKKGQYNYIPGYMSRILKDKQDLFRDSWSFVPLTLEAIWAHNATLPLSRLIKGLNIEEMCRRPQHAVLEWAGAICVTLKELEQESRPNPIDRVVDSINKDCSLPYSQANLAQSLGLTPAYFCRLFKEKTGFHFSQYMTKVRIDHAQAMWRQDYTLSLDTVSQACGYPHKSYFCQVFKKSTGLTPGQFQERMKDEANA